MILKGNQRGNGGDLAIHLMNGYDNQRVEVAQVRGTVATDLMGAFAEFEAVAAGTRMMQPLYSLSINPSAPLTRADYDEAIRTIEDRLGLTGQPRAVVFHVKDGREHCHVVWSRTDLTAMRAIPMAHDRRKLMDLSCELAEKFGLDLPPGLKAWAEKRKLAQDKLDATLAERAQQKETGITPEQRRAEITQAYEGADSAPAFRQALEQKGYLLARGDRRGLVVVDRFGNVHSLTLYLKGHKAKDVNARLAVLGPADLLGVDQAKEQMRQRLQAEQDRAREQGLDREEREELEETRRLEQAALAKKQAFRRAEFQGAEQEMLTRQQAERLALHAAQSSEGKSFLFRVRTAVADLINRTPGLRSVLQPLQKMTQLDPRERHKLENEALARRHARGKLDADRKRRFLARIETRERRALDKALRREERLALEARLEREHGAVHAQKAETAMRQDFFDAARDQGLWKDRAFTEGELTEDFNEAAGLTPDDGYSGDDDDGYTSDDWGPDDDGTDDDQGPKPRPRRGRGRGFGHRRNLA